VFCRGKTGGAEGERRDRSAGRNHNHQSSEIGYAAEMAKKTAPKELFPRFFASLEIQTSDQIVRPSRIMTIVF